MATKKSQETKDGKHLGLRLSGDVSVKLDKLVADEAAKAGPHAVVNLASFVIGLIEVEYERRFGKK